MEDVGARCVGLSTLALPLFYIREAHSLPTSNDQINIYFVPFFLHGIIIMYIYIES